MEECMMRMVADTKVFEASLEMVFEYSYRTCENYLKALGKDLDFFYIGDDVASQRGMIFDPALWRRHYKDKFRAMCDLGRKYGKPVWFHSCGDITSILPDLIEVGINVWETVQLHTLPMPPEKLKREYGADIVFFGGVNTQALPFRTPEQVRQEALCCMRVLGEGGGYILGPDHHIKPDVPAENTLALFHAPL
jgi:uroporphyrinogen decarboxylase